MSESHKALKRMLANGPLTAIPKRPSDQQLLVTLAAARFELGKSYRESEVNDLLEAWLQTFCEPYGIDHVSFRRMLVDSRLITRTKSGSAYEAAARADLAEPLPEPAQVLEAMRVERESRKRRHAA
jgi:hypothetical protein